MTWKEPISFGLKLDVEQRGLWHLDGLLAVGADAAREALGEDQVDGGRHEERLDAHVEQAGDAAGRVVGVQRREHHVAGERRLHGDLARSRSRASRRP
jgi:hypothetical protein